MTSPIPITEELLIHPGPALLAEVDPGRTLADHRRRRGTPARLGVESLQAMTEAAAVRGRGGAGFPFATKLATAARGRRPVVVVNASEGEPVSAKDAALATVAPHLVLDGAATAARALRARDIHVVLPGDRPRARGLLAAAVAERDDAELRWHTSTAHPRFVAGQARAVIELLEGRPNLPVTAWTPEAVRGLKGRPTLLSNAETWAHVGLIALEGLAPTLARGTHEEPGTTLLTLHLPGLPTAVHEVEHGTRFVDLLPDRAAGGPVLLGGFHGTWATWEQISRAHVSRSGLAAAGLSLGAGVVLAPGTAGCALALTEQITGHLAAESAGRCGPCVNGLPALADAVADLRRGRPDALPRVRRLCGLLPGRGACAHPDGTARLVASLLTALPDEVDAHARGRCTRTTPVGAAR